VPGPWPNHSTLSQPAGSLRASATQDSIGGHSPSKSPNIADLPAATSGRIVPPASGAGRRGWAPPVKANRCHRSALFAKKQESPRDGDERIHHFRFAPEQPLAVRVPQTCL
jgi:hypothetical protein